MRSSLPRYSWLLPVALLIGSCDTKAKQELTRRLNETSDKLIECKKENNALTQEVASLKRQLAQAMANPSRLVLTDPEIINLIASIKAAAPAGDTGGLDPAVATRVVSQGARALQQCYERALKKNSALQYQSGIGLTLEVKVAPHGSVQDVGVNPSVDGEMTSCIKTAAMRWKFPTFSGNAVTIEQKITLTPTKT
jgi:hypothetical protein